MGRAIEYRRFGGPEVLEEVERPTQAPGDGEVRIAVRAVGLNPLDFKTFEAPPARPTPAERSPPSWWHPPAMSSRSQPRCHSRRRPVWVLPRKPRAAHSDS